MGKMKARGRWLPLGHGKSAQGLGKLRGLTTQILPLSPHSFPQSILDHGNLVS